MLIDAEVLKAAQADLGRREFYHYCRMRIPAVYTDKRPHLETLCNQLQAFVESPDRMNLIICMPPRFGKSTSAQLLSEWFLGQHPDKSIITASYNELLSSRFSRSVRNGISERPVPGSTRRVFSDFFPGVQIKDGDSAMQMWSLEGSFFSYLATSPGGTVTGIGATGLLIVDDVIKNAEEAYNARVLEDVWSWYCDTLQSRVEIGAKRIVIMTRWATGDLVGRLLEAEPGQWELIKMPAQNADGSMLCEDILPLQIFEERKRLTDPVIISGNYQQEPYDSLDKLYGTFKTYDPAVRVNSDKVLAVIDTADQGSDYLAGIVFAVEENTAYVLDVLYTKEGMEITENKAARMLASHCVKEAIFESNNGGRGFARNVERIMREKLQYTECSVTTFTQTANKVARILSNSTNVTNQIVFPDGWELRWPQFYRDVTTAGRVKWLHDDAFDALTLVVENLTGRALVLDPADQEALARRWE